MRMFYGWVIVIVGFLSYFVMTTQFQVVGVLIEPMTNGLGWTKTQMMGAFSLAAITSGLASPLIGRLLDKYGTRYPMAAAGLIAGAILLGVSQISQLWQLYLLYGIVFGLLRSALADLPAGTAIANWFVRKRGRAVALTMTGIPVGAAVLVPLAQYLVSHYGWRYVWGGMAFLIWTLICVPVVLFMRRRPEDLGLSPDGTASNRPAETTHAMPDPTSPEEPNFTVHEAVATKTFWLVLAATVLATAMGGPALVIYLVPFLASNYLTPEAAARVYTFFAFGWIGSRLLWGFIADRVHVRYVFMSYAFGLSVGIIMLIASRPSGAAIGALLFYIGLMLGGGGVVNNVIWPNYFGRKAVGAIRGYAMPFWYIGLALSPLLVAYLFDRTQSYQVGFGLSAAWHLLAAGVITFAKPLNLVKPSRHYAG